MERVQIEFDNLTATANLCWLFTYVWDHKALRDSDYPYVRDAAGIMSLSLRSVRETPETVKMIPKPLSDEELNLVRHIVPLSRAIWQGGIDFQDQMFREWALRWIGEEGGGPECLLEHVEDPWADNGKVVWHNRAGLGKLPPENPFGGDTPPRPGSDDRLVVEYANEFFNWCEAVEYCRSAREAIMNGDDYHEHDRLQSYNMFDMSAAELADDTWWFTREEALTPLESLLRHAVRWFDTLQHAEDKSPFPELEGPLQAES